MTHVAYVNHYAIPNDWHVWCATALAKVEEIQTFLQTNPKDTEDAWNRPNVYLASSYGTRLHISVRLPQHTPLSLGVESYRGAYLYRHIPRFDNQSRQVGSTEARVYLDKSWDAQDGIVHNTWPDAWNDVHEVLDALMVSLRTDTPLGSTKTWEQTLNEHLSQQHKNEINPQEWKDWAHRWGTPAMEAAVDVVNSLLDLNDDVLAWRTAVLASWQLPQCTVQHDIPDDWFGMPSPKT